MKCPYREVIRFIKPEPVTLSTPNGYVTINLIQSSEFAECEGEECPFYRDSEAYREPFCAKADIETGGEYL